MSGTLRLTDITLNNGLIDVSSSNFDSFDYGGSSLLNPFTFTDPLLITGELSPIGEVQPGSPLRIETSAGDFSNFCTPLGEQVLGSEGCGFVGIASFELFSDGSWMLSGIEPSDVGGQLQPATVPEPASRAAGSGAARRRVRAPAPRTAGAIGGLPGVNSYR